MFMHIFAWGETPPNLKAPPDLKAPPNLPKGEETMRMGISVVGTESCVCA